MELSITEKIRIIMKRRNIMYAELAEKLGMSRQNLSNKFSRSSFTNEEYKRIAEILKCEYKTIFIPLEDIEENRK